MNTMLRFKVITNPLKLWLLKLEAKLSKNSGWQTMRSNSSKMTHVKLHDHHYLYLSDRTKARWVMMAIGDATNKDIPTFIQWVKAKLDAIDSKMDDVFCAVKMAMPYKKEESYSFSKSTRKDGASFNSFLNVPVEALGLVADRKKMINNVKKGKMKKLYDKVDNVTVDKKAIVNERYDLDPDNYEPLTDDMLELWPKDAIKRPEVIDSL